jgi:uncharacterized RDD family membrane protein YckC
VDGVIVWGVATALKAALGIPAFAVHHDDEGKLLLGVALGALVALAYLPTVMRQTNGRTLGKYVFGIRVVRSDERPMTFTVATVREVLCKQLIFGFAIFDVFIRVGGSLLVALVDYLWPLGDHGNRAVHDRVARTRVVRA